QGADPVKLDRLHIAFERGPPAFVDLRRDKGVVLLSGGQHLLDETEPQARGGGFAVFPPHLCSQPAFLLSDSQPADLEFAFSNEDTCPAASAQLEREAALDHQAVVWAVGHFLAAYSERRI